MKRGKFFNGKRARREFRAGGDVAVPDLVDVETVAVLRKRWLRKTISAVRFAAGIDDLEDLAIDRYPTLRFMRRAYQLRDSVTAYDATYTALAETLGCQLVTCEQEAFQSQRTSVPNTAAVMETAFASSNRATGGYDVRRLWTVGSEIAVWSDNLYGVTKPFCEALGRYFAYERRMSVICLRIGWVLDTPQRAGPATLAQPG